MPKTESKIESASDTLLSQQDTSINMATWHEIAQVQARLASNENQSPRGLPLTQLATEELNAVLVELNGKLNQIPVLTSLFSISLFATLSLATATFFGMSNYLTFAMPSFVLLMFYMIVKSQRIQNQLTFFTVILPRLDAELTKHGLTLHTLITHIQNHKRLRSLKDSLTCWVQSCSTRSRDN